MKLQYLIFSQYMRVIWLSDYMSEQKPLVPARYLQLVIIVKNFPHEKLKFISGANYICGCRIKAIISGFHPEDVGSIPTTRSNSSTRLGAILGKCEIESKSQEYTAILMEQLSHWDQEVFREKSECGNPVYGQKTRSK